MVISCSGDTTNGAWGRLTRRIGVGRGLDGVGTDGKAGDARDIIEIGLPVFACGLTPNSPFKDGPGAVNTPVNCGGVTVQPGDIVVGDCDGVVVIPQALAEAVLERVSAIQTKEAAVRAEIEAGQPIPSWAARLLREKGL